MNSTYTTLMVRGEQIFTEPLTDKNYRDVLAHLKKSNKNIFRQITKAGMDFQDAIFNYMADFLFNEMLLDTYDFTKLFGL